MLALTIGPLAVPANLLSLLIAGVVAAVVGRWVGRRDRATTGGVIGDMALAGFVAARLVFIVLWFDRYRASPWGVLDVRDGGFTAWAGVLSAMLVGAWHAWRRPLLRKPLAYGLVAGVAIWLLSAGLFSFGSGPALAALDSPTLTTLAGAPARLAAKAGKPVVVNLWATWCPPCRREMPVLEAARKERPDIDFVFVNQGENGDTVGAYLRHAPVSADNVLLDPARSIAKAASSSGLPTTLFYDGRGRLVATHIGALSTASLAAALADIAPAPH